jgi:hypothetical protein
LNRYGRQRPVYHVERSSDVTAKMRACLVKPARVADLIAASGRKAIWPEHIVVEGRTLQTYVARSAPVMEPKAGRVTIWMDDCGKLSIDLSNLTENPQFDRVSGATLRRGRVSRIHCIVGGEC